MRLKTVQEKIKFLENEIEYLGGYTYSFSFKSFLVIWNYTLRKDL